MGKLKRESQWQKDGCLELEVGKILRKHHPVKMHARWSHGFVWELWSKSSELIVADCESKEITCENGEANPGGASLRCEQPRVGHGGALKSRTVRQGSGWGFARHRRELTAHGGGKAGHRGECSPEDHPQSALEEGGL